MEIQRAYLVGDTLYFPLLTKGSPEDLYASATHASGDSRIMKDGGAWANSTNAFASEGEGWYSIVLTSGELTAKVIVVKIVDQGTKAWVDQNVIITTFGNASAQFPDATLNANVVSLADDSVSSGALATTAVTEIVAAVWNAVRTSYVTAGTMGASMGFAYTGAITGATTTTLTFTSAEADDFFNGGLVQVYAGTGVNQIRKITDSEETGGVNVATVDFAFDPVPDSTSKIVIFK